MTTCCPHCVDAGDLFNTRAARRDLRRYRSLISYTDDFTLMSPFGGTPTRAAYFTRERMEAIKIRRFQAA